MTNDDGIDAPGLAALAKALSTAHEVVVAAPAAEQSGMAHALTVHRDIEVCAYGGLGEVVAEAWSIDGTPTDCVKIYLEAIAKREDWPELVISGVNKGANLGTDVLYSGTVGGALEGYMHGIPAIALSLDVHSSLSFDETSAIFAHKLPWIFGQAVDDFFLNVNFPKQLRNIAQNAGNQDALCFSLCDFCTKRRELCKRMRGVCAETPTRDFGLPSRAFFYIMIKYE